MQKIMTIEEFDKAVILQINNIVLWRFTGDERIDSI